LSLSLLRKLSVALDVCDTLLSRSLRLVGSKALFKHLIVVLLTAMFGLLFAFTGICQCSSGLGFFLSLLLLALLIAIVGILVMESLFLIVFFLLQLALKLLVL